MAPRLHHASLIGCSHFAEGHYSPMKRPIMKFVAALTLGGFALTACGDADNVEASDDLIHIVYTPLDEGVAATYLRNIFEDQA